MTEKREEQPTAMNAFELISMSKGLKLDNLFDAELVGLHEILTYMLMHRIQFAVLIAIHISLICCLIQGFKRETRFTSKCPANEIINKIEQAAKPLGFDIQKKNYKVSKE